MPTPLSPDEMAQLQAYAQSVSQPAAPPPGAGPLLPPPAAPPAPDAAPPPWATGPTGAPPTALAGGGPMAHQPPGFRPPSVSGVGADQTTGYTGPRDANGNPLAAPPVPVQPLVSTTSGSTVQKGVHFSPETKSAEKDWLGKQKEAETVEDAGFAQARAAQQQGVSDKAAAMRASAEAAQIEGDRGAARLDEKRAHIAAMNDALQNDKTDPDHWWHSRATAGKIGAAIAMIAGGALAGLRGGENQGAKFITEAIDRDIAAQRDAHAAKRDALQGQTTMYNLASQGFHDDQERHAATRAVMLKAATDEIDAKAAAAQDPLERARLLHARAELARETTTTLASLDEKASDKVTMHSNSTTQKGGPGSGAELPADRVVKGPDGRVYMAPSAAEAAKLRERNVVAERFQKNIQQIEGLRGFVGNGLYSSDAHQKMNVLAQDLKRDYLFLNGEKLKSGGNTQDLVNAAIGDPSSFLDWNGGARLAALKQSVGTDLSDAYAASGAIPLSGDVGYANQGGKLVATGTGLDSIAPPKRGGK